jgi:hypothetical protein
MYPLPWLLRGSKCERNESVTNLKVNHVCVVQALHVGVHGSWVQHHRRGAIIQKYACKMRGDKNE